MAGAADYLKLMRPVQPFDAGEMFSDAQKGMALAKDIDERQTLADIGIAYKKGGLNAAKDAAFGAGRIDHGIKMGQHGIHLSQEERAKVADALKQTTEMGIAASNLRGPQYESYLDSFAAKGSQVDQYRGEQGRQMLINASKLTTDKLRAEIAQSQASAASSNATAAHTREQTRMLPETVGLERDRTRAQIDQAQASTGLTRVQTQAAERELNSPKVGTADLGPGHSRVFYDPRNGTELGRLDGPKQNKPDDKFTEAAATKQADRFDETIRQGNSQNAAMSDINTLRQLSGRLGEPGVSNTVTRQFGPTLRAMGLAPERLSDMEAFNALVSRLVPMQRPPGSGTMSDRDVELFRTSLPQLAATAQGRNFILDQMQAIAEYDIARSRISSAAINGEITRSQAEQALRQIPDPMSLFRAQRGQGTTARPRAVNPQTGQTVEFDGTNWVPAR